MASASFALDDFVGSLAPTDGKLLYMARVNPILTFAPEIVLDVDETSAAKPADIQRHFLRQLLQVGHVLCWLHFSLETRLLPLRCRRVILAVSCLIYLLRLPDNHYAHIALQESKSLLRDGFSCWIADLKLGHFPSSLQKAIERSCDEHLYGILSNFLCYRAIWTWARMGGLMA